MKASTGRLLLALLIVITTVVVLWRSCRRPDPIILEPIPVPDVAVDSAKAQNALQDAAQHRTAADSSARVDSTLEIQEQELLHHGSQAHLPELQRSTAFDSIADSVLAREPQ